MVKLATKSLCCKRQRKMEKKEELSEIETNRYAKIKANDVMLYSMTRHP